MASSSNSTIYIATRGSELALKQANTTLDQLKKLFPRKQFDLKIMKTTGDQLQTASLSNPDPKLPKGLFTKELETALLEGEASLAVHSLKDLPTELPPGLKLGAVLKREDPCDVLVFRDESVARVRRMVEPPPPREWSPGRAEMPYLRGFNAGTRISDLPENAVVATSSARREAQLKRHRPDLRITAIRGNVGTRLNKLLSQTELDATILAAAGLIRLGFRIQSDGKLGGRDQEFPGLMATRLEADEMISCPGQGIIGLEIREDDSLAQELCSALNHSNSWKMAITERAFLNQMGGGCQSPVAALAEIRGHLVHLNAISFMHEETRTGQAEAPPQDAEVLGRRLADELKAGLD